VQHRKVEAGTVPGHELRRVLLDPVEETLDDLAFSLPRAADRPHPENLRIAQRARDRDHAVQMQRQEIVADRLSSQLKGHGGHIGVRDCGIDRVQLAQPRHIRHGFDVESESRCHGSNVRWCTIVVVRMTCCPGLLANPRAACILVIPARA
jgi:hypothetical protein